jgi:two-component system response regulator DevR
MSTRIFIVDDHEVVRRGLRDLLDAEDDLAVVGEADSVASALAPLPRADVDVAVLDVRLPNGDGVELCQTLKADGPDLKCLSLTRAPTTTVC